MTAMNTAVLTAIFLSLSCFTSPASAIYKCEQDDVITYTDIPCDGQELSVTVPQKSRGAEEKPDEKSIARGEIAYLLILPFALFPYGL